MGFVFRRILELGPAGFVLKAIVASLVGIGLLLAFILVRRMYRRRYFRRLNARTLALRKQWNEIVGGAVPSETWLSHRLDRKIIEAMLLDSLEAAPPAEVPALLGLLRSSGLLDLRIGEARTFPGWRRQRALVSIGRMRALEAIPALAEGLDDANLETRIAAVRGLGHTGLPEAATQILVRAATGELDVPAAPLQAALVSCCRSKPGLLLPYLQQAQGKVREVLARVLGELATPDMEEELLVLAGDSLAEVRASAARALGKAKPRLALPVLCALVSDPEWFVRLRAVAGLSALEDPRAIPAMVEALRDMNRYVRLRAAASLARLDAHLEDILERVLETHDLYALQTLISELERSGRIEKLIVRLTHLAQGNNGAAVVLEALRKGSRQLWEAVNVGPKPERVAGS